LKPVQFKQAVSYIENRKYLKYAVIPIAIVLLFFIISPQILSQSTYRIVSHNRYFQAELPFQFNLLNDSLKTIKNQDFDVKLKVKGHTIPDNVYINYEGKEFMMTRYGTDLYTFTLKNLLSNLTFRFRIDKYNSSPFDLMVLPKPLLMKFLVKITYPPYLKKNPTP